MAIVAKWVGIVAVGMLAAEVLPMPAWFGSGPAAALAGVCVVLGVCEDVLAWRRRRARLHGGETARPAAARAETGRDWQTVLEARVARLRQETRLTAVAAAVAVDGRLAGTAADGERRRRGGVPVTVDDRWHVGSVTKSMTATLLAVLEDDGRLAADAPLPALLPDVEMADGWRACTLHHLLTHTAGAPADLPPRCRNVWPATAEALVAERRRVAAGVLAAAPESPCGERFAYSNVGYTVAGHVAETVAAAPFPSRRPARRTRSR